MREKIKPLKRYISSAEKLELINLSKRFRDILSIKFYEANEAGKRKKWNWLYNTADGQRFRLLQYKRAKHNIARRLTDPGTIGRDFDRHTIEIYEIELKAPRGFSVFTLDKTGIQAKIFKAWRGTPAGSNWAELKRNIAMIQRGKLTRCKIERRNKGKILTYKKKWVEDSSTFKFNTFNYKKGKGKIPPTDSRKFSVLNQWDRKRTNTKRDK